MTSIFDSDDLEVDFTQLEIDMVELAQSRILYQFQNSGIMLALAGVLADMEQQGYDAALGTLRGRTIAEAEGANLDVLGDIVGQDRILLNAENRIYFGPDEIDPRISGPDQGNIFTRNAPLFGDLIADDFDYRRLILSKIFKNHVKVGSVAEIIVFISLLTGNNVSVQTVGPMELDLVVPSDMTANDLRTVLTVQDDRIADRKYLTPLPATANFVNIVFRPTNGFAPDRVSGRADFAAVAIRIGINTVLGV